MNDPDDNLVTYTETADFFGHEIKREVQRVPLSGEVEREAWFWNDLKKFSDKELITLYDKFWAILDQINKDKVLRTAGPLLSKSHRLAIRKFIKFIEQQGIDRTETDRLRALMNIAPPKPEPNCNK